MRHLTLSIGLVSLVLVAAAPVVQPSTDDATFRPANVPAGVQVIDMPADGTVEVSGTPDLEALLTEHVTPDEPSSLTDALAQHLAAVWDTNVLRASDPTPSPEAETTDEVEEHEQQFVWPAGHHVATGDFDGDTIDDVLAIAWGGDSATLHALRGLDGAELWQVELGWESLGWPAGDLTGDGADDLLTVDRDYDGATYADDCDDDGCSYRYESAWTTTLTARSGADGEVLWTMSHGSTSRHEYEDRWSDDGWSSRSLTEFTGLAGFPYPGDDHDGDGGRDVLMNVLDLTDSLEESASYGMLVVRESRGAAHLDSSTAATVVSGADGSTVLGPLTSSGPMVALLDGAGDATGDGRADLLWQSAEATNDTWSCTDFFVSVCEDERDTTTPTVRLELLDGVTLSSVWTSRHEIDEWHGGGATPLRADVDGVAGDDLLLTALPTEDGPLLADPLAQDDPWDDPSALHLLSGSSGETVWSADAPMGELHDVADLGGAPSADLLFAGSALSGSTTCSTDLDGEEECEHSTEASTSIVHVGGRDGSVLSDTTRTWDLGDHETHFYWWAWSHPGDHDGDGLTDLTVNMGTGAQGIAAVQSTRSGQVLYQDQFDGWLGTMFATTPGDLDATGTDELAVSTGWFEPTQILSMPDGALLHELTYTDGLSPSGDHDGVIGDELVRVRAEQDGDVLRTFVESVHGVSLEARWTVELPAWEYHDEDWDAEPASLD